MHLARWIAGALLASSQFAHAAVCVSGPPRLGTLQEPVGTAPSASFSAACAAMPWADPNDPDDWSFSNRYRFSLAEAATQVYGYLDLNFTRTGQLFPNSPTPGEPYFRIHTQSIWFEHNGVRTYVGTEGAGHDEMASIFAFDLAAGDYLMGIDGYVYDTPSRAGWYEGFLNVVYAGETAATPLSLQAVAVAAPVPEPATVAMLLLAVPAVAGVAARRRRAAPAASAA